MSNCWHFLCLGIVFAVNAHKQFPLSLPIHWTPNTFPLPQQLKSGQSNFWTELWLRSHHSDILLHQSHCFWLLQWNFVNPIDVHLVFSVFTTLCIVIIIIISLDIVGKYMNLWTLGPLNPLPLTFNFFHMAVMEEVLNNQYQALTLSICVQSGSHCHFSRSSLFW